MASITRCPSCGTRFKVVPDQLKVSGGWVRCGHCGDVFDARLHLDGQALPSRPITPSPSAPPIPRRPLPAPPSHPAPPALLPRPASPGATQVVTPGREEAKPAPETTASATTTVVAVRPVAPQPDGLPHAVRATEVIEGRRTDSAFDRLAPTEAPHAEPEPSSPSIPASPPETGVAPASSATGLQASAPAEPGFIRQARRRAFWEAPGVRAVLLLMVWVLGLGLLAQWAVHERDRLAAMHPEMTPWLTRLCEPLGCVVRPWRHLDGVAIDSAVLLLERGDRYRLDVALRNRTPHTLALPALELQLTDARNQVLASRVFLPADWPTVPVEVLPGGETLQFALPLELTLPEAPAGYLARVFHP